MLAHITFKEEDLLLNCTENLGIMGTILATI